ncbi:hypothetical protein G7047_26320 [Diaphorobacter sp. HDW4A]|uniref:hypothetical protein n=1 Tax=Diaphorobacter sp. HDW4A TaxID=2714924 RepID=UPI0014076A1E|nr:hypothetical protein [Diaphorobacter sp. HDW4A]QIL83063.1 hypothetical protein G7047_26320 [Diaphorobacter sp. HDW4A]
MRFISSQVAAAVIVLGVVGVLAGCTTTGSSARSPGSQAGDSSGVTVFGTVDAGVGGVK